MAATDKEVKDGFEEFDIIIPDENCLDKLVTIAEMFSFDADSIVNEWLAFQSQNKNCEMNYCHLESLQRELTNTQSKQINKNKTMEPAHTAANVHRFFDNDSNENDVQDMMSSYCSPINKEKMKKIQIKPSPKTPLSAKTTNNNANIYSPTITSPQSGLSQKYSMRTNAGEVVVELCRGDSPKEGVWSKSSNSINNNLVQRGHFTNLDAHKYMFQKIIEVSDVLNDGIESAADEIQKRYSAEIESFSPCSVPNQSPVVTVGRIASENGVRLSPHSVVLEGDRFHSFGRTVSVDLENLPEYSLFPGQIVAFRGTNPSGNKLIATEVFTLPCSEGRVEVGNTTFLKEDDDSVMVLTAVGPFTTSDCMSYEPLLDFINIVKTKKPDITILVGPLLDSQHENIKNFNIDQPVHILSQSWIKSIRSALEGYTHLVLVPSHRDIFHHPIYPQPPYKQNVTNDKSVSFMPDPCTFDFGGVRFGLTSTDVLFHLGAEEISRSKPGQSTDRLSRLTKHILTQQCYYPLYPSHESLSVDWINAENEAHMPTDRVPDILIVPSDLKSFAKTINGHLCINPGRLAKGLSGGTYTQMILQNCGKETMHAVAQIVKI